jgi:P-type Ca2+ transporter type 2C
MSQVIALNVHRQLRQSKASKTEESIAGNRAAFELLSALPGRVRCKIPALYRSPAFKQHIEQRLAGHDQITAVSANALTGSVLILFDRGHDPATITALLFTAFEEVPASSGTVRSIAPSTETSRPLGKQLRKLIPHRQDQEVQPWHQLEADTVLTALGGTRTGLTPVQVQEHLKKYGPNLLPEATPRSELGMFVGQFRSLPVALLGASAVVSVLTGGLADALVILGVVMINATLGYVTESQAEKTIKSLTGPVQPFALTIRAGVLQTVPAAELVVGDLLVLAPGNTVTADARLIEARRLMVDESSLTGESLPVTKHSARLTATDVPLADRDNMVYRGTLVTGGQGLAVVVAIGPASEIGRIQQLAGEAQAPETPMERQLRVLGNQLVWISIGVCGGVFVVGMLRGYGALQMLKTAVSLAVAAVPEGLPTVATTTLALGLRNMRRQKVLIRHLEAVETLGSVQTICLDKTGTLTLNRMSVTTLFIDATRLTVAGGRVLHAGQELDVSAHPGLQRLIEIAVLCNETEINGHAGAQVLNGSATENALVHLALSAGLDVLGLRARHARLSIDYRSENRLYMSTLHELAPGKRLLAIKGSPGEVLALCGFTLDGGAMVTLSDERRQVIRDENERMAGEALRVLGIAYTEVDGETSTPEDGLVWLGLVGMADPVRAGVPDLIQQFHRAGIETVMITGDQSPTAHAIGRQLNLSGSDRLDILDSSHLENVEPATLAALAQRVHVFARVSPSHKLRIVEALQRAGKVVAMTGDGINDGPALKAADIGIAMGRSGTDVAREVADVVLEDDNLETLIVAVSQGRTIYANIRKSVHYLLSSNISEITIMFGAIALGLGQPLNPMQLLWINLITDIFPGLGLALEAPEPDVLENPPRDPAEAIVRAADFRRILFEAGTLSAGTLAAYGYGVARYGVGPQAGTLAFMGITNAQLAHAISCRSERHSVFGAEKLPPNRTLTTAIGASLALQTATVFVPGLRQFLGLAPITLIDGAVIGAAALVPFVVNEASKPPLRHKGSPP